MSTPLNMLVDVHQLSKLRCLQPIRGDLKYAIHENFLGRKVVGYDEQARDVFLLTRYAAEMLCKVQDYLIENYHYGLYIFDAYRPLQAVKDFVEWFKQPPAGEYELQRKQIHYPHLEKQQLAPLGYVADVVSRHCYGNTVDLSLINLATNELLDMGVCFDYFDELAHPTATAEQIGLSALNNRQLLAEAMQRYGFHVYEKEYWHFDHEKQELFDPIDIPITLNLKAIGISS